MATPLREIFVQFAAEFDFEGFDEANKQTEALKGNLTAVGQTASRTGTRSVALRGALTGVAGGLASTGVQAGLLGVQSASLTNIFSNMSNKLNAAGVQTSILTRILSFLKNPITLVIAAITAIVLGFVAWIAVTKSLISTMFEFASSMAVVGGAIANISARLGIATADLQAWSQALAEGNLGADKLADALTDLGEKMGASIQDPASGTARLFRRLGIELKDSEGNVRNVGDVFLDLAEAMENTESAAERITNANQLMGGSGRELIPILVQGRAGLEAYREQLGLSQPEFEEFIDNSIKLGVEQAKLNQAWEGTKQILFNLVAPAIIWIVSKLQELNVWLNNNRGALDALKVAAVVLAAAFVVIGALLGVLAGIILAVLVLAFFTLLTVLAAVTLAFGAVILAVQDFITFLEGGDSVFERFLGWLFDIPNALRQMVIDLVSTDSTLGRFLDTLSAVANALLRVINVGRRLKGLSEIQAVDFRQDAEDVLPEVERGSERQIRRQALIEDVRGAAQDFFGVEDPALSRRERTTRSLRQQGIPTADIPGLVPRGLQPTPIQTVSSGARAAAQARTVQNIITQNNEMQFVINEATDTDGVQRVINEALTTQNRDLQEVLGGAEG